MSGSRERAVFDCNVFFQALINRLGPAGRCVSAAIDGRVELYCSARIFAELTEVATRPQLRPRFAALTDDRTRLLIESIECVAVFVENVPEVFALEREPDDAHYVNLAIVTGAKYVVSRDKDLTDLSDPSTEAGRDFRRRSLTIEIIEPQDLLKRLEQSQ